MCQSKLQHPPPGMPRAYDSFSLPGGREFDELNLPGDGAFDHHSYGVGNLIASLNCMLRVVLIPDGLLNHGRHDRDKL